MVDPSCCCFMFGGVVVVCVCVLVVVLVSEYAFVLFMSVVDLHKVDFSS